MSGQDNTPLEECHATFFQWTVGLWVESDRLKCFVCPSKAANACSERRSGGESAGETNKFVGELIDALGDFSVGDRSVAEG